MEHLEVASKAGAAIVIEPHQTIVVEAGFLLSGAPAEQGVLGLHGFCHAASPS